MPIIFSDGFQVFQNENSDKCRQIWILTAFSDVPMKVLMWSNCLISLKRSQFAIFACIILLWWSSPKKLLEIISMVCLFSLSQIATLLNFLDIFLWIKDLRVLFLRLLGCFELLLVEVLVPVKFQISDFFMSYYEENTFAVPNREHWKIVIESVCNNDCSLFQRNVFRSLVISNTSFGNIHINRKFPSYSSKVCIFTAPF